MEMNNAAKLTTEFLEQKGFHYELRGEQEEVVRMSFKMDNRESMPVLVIFDEDEKSMQLIAPGFVKIPEGKKEMMYYTCNEMNAMYRWVKFMVCEEDDTVDIRLDSMLPDNYDGEWGLNCALRIANIADEAYPHFMRAIWSQEL